MVAGGTGKSLVRGSNPIGSVFSFFAFSAAVAVHIQITMQHANAVRIGMCADRDSNLVMSGLAKRFFFENYFRKGGFYKEKVMLIRQGKGTEEFFSTLCRSLKYWVVRIRTN